MKPCRALILGYKFDFLWTIIDKKLNSNAFKQILNAEECRRKSWLIKLDL